MFVHFATSAQPVTLRVKIEPVPRGELVIKLGEAIFQSQFDASGEAVVVDIPETVLFQPDGPDMLIGTQP
ncbi:MAG: hypothetical protein HC837_18340 [Chloroflexaceae bacterium]|nr:hypothetical protein [Chloroflexaceae bacterium]